MESLLIRNGQIVTMNAARQVFRGDLLISDGRLAAIGANLKASATTTIDATDKVVLPGLVQTHVHLSQTLFRGLADDLTLLDWLKRRIWPLEAAHDEESLHCSALLGCAELFRCGTTCILDMETVHHTSSALRALETAGIRATTGKVMMDAGEGMPSGLLEPTERSLAESLDLLKEVKARQHVHGGRLRYAFAPRFVLSCSEELLSEVGKLARQFGAMVHTHASESAGECRKVKELKGYPNVEYLHRVGLTGPHVALAHCVHLEPQEFEILASTGTRVAHCPSSNLKLGSGIADVPRMLEMGISVSLGADGAACNNNLDIFQEMRLAALLQSYRAGPGSLPASRCLEMATIEGARALGLEKEIGSIEVGKRADLCILDLKKPHAAPARDFDGASAIVYAAKAEDVETTIVDGQIVMRDRALTTMDEEWILHESGKCLRGLLKRAGLG